MTSIYGRAIGTLIGMALFAFAIWLTPSHLTQLGIMDQSLTSENELTHQVAQLEVTVVKYTLFVLSGVLVGLAMFAPMIASATGYQSFMAQDLRFPKRYEDIVHMVIDRAFVVMVSLSIFIAVAKGMFAHPTLAFINAEDGLIEYGSAVLLLVASITAGYTGLTAQIRSRPRGFLFFLALLFFAMCGEGISWGQRIFGFATPEALSDLNVQQELNLHNMFGYVFDHLFILCFFIWGCVLPALYHMFPTARQVLRWIGLPLPSIGLAIGMFIITIYQEQLLYRLFEPVPLLRIPEMRELLSATAFLLMMHQCVAGFRRA